MTCESDGARWVNSAAPGLWGDITRCALPATMDPRVLRGLQLAAVSGSRSAAYFVPVLLGRCHFRKALPGVDASGVRIENWWTPSDWGAAVAGAQKGALAGIALGIAATKDTKNPYAIGGGILGGAIIGGTVGAAVGVLDNHEKQIEVYLESKENAQSVGTGGDG